MVKRGGKKKDNIDWAALRPTSLDWTTRGQSDVAKVPTIPLVGFSFAYDLYNYSDLLRTIVNQIGIETFRNGLYIKAKFVKKCARCQTEYQQDVNECEVCHSGEWLRPPNMLERKTLEELISKANLNEMTLDEVLWQIDIDLNLLDNAYLFCLKEYEVNEDGEIIGAKAIEFLRASPERMELIMDRNGRYARTDDGRVVLFCLTHRDNYVLVQPEQAENARCSKCGWKLYPAFMRARKQTFGAQGTGGRFDSIYYTFGEILHVKKFTHNIGYGVPPVWSIWMKLITLMKQDEYIMLSYDLQRPPKGILILNGNRDSIDKAWMRLEEEAKANPHMIYPLVIEGKSMSGQKLAEFIDLSMKPNEVEFTTFRDEARRQVGALYGVMPIFSGESGGTGLSNEGLQIVVTNRAVKREQKIFNEKVLKWIVRQAGVGDWELMLRESEGQDMVAQIQRDQMRMNNALLMKSLGYDADAVMGADGIEFIYRKGDIAVPEKYDELGRRRVMSARNMENFEQEPEHGRMSAEQPKVEGQPKMPRTPKEVMSNPFGSSVRPVENVVSVTGGNVSDEFWFTVVDETEKELIQKVWSPAYIQRKFGAGRVGKYARGFSYKYAGLTDEQADRINDALRMAVRQGLKDKELLVKIVKYAGDVDDVRAEMIVSTELNEITNRLKEDAYKETTKVQKFSWVTKSPNPCPFCVQLAGETRNGVTLEVLKKRIRELSVMADKEFVLHPNCRCSFRPANVPPKY